MPGIGGIVDLNGRPVDPGTVSAMARAAAGDRDGDPVTDGNESARVYSLPLQWESAGLGWSADGRRLVVADARFDHADEPPAAMILSGYEKLGTSAASGCLGDYAFAVIDFDARAILLGRDPMSLRPLVFWHSDGLVAFASEPSHLLASGLVDKRINERAVAGHLAGGVFDPTWTFFEGIEQVPPGHVVTVSPRGVASAGFWDLEPGAVPNDATAELAHLLQEAVRVRLPPRSAGIMLSGGLDSGSLAAAAAQVRNDTSVRAFSFAFPTTPTVDERHLSDPLAAALEIPVTEIDADSSPPLAEFPAGPDLNDPLYGHYEPLLHATVGRAADGGVEAMMLGNRGDLMTGSEVYAWSGMLTDLGIRRTWSELASFGRRSALASAWKEAVRPLLVDKLPQPVRLELAKHRKRPWQSWVNPDFAEATNMGQFLTRFSAPADLGGPAGRRQRTILSPFQMRVASWSQRMHAARGVRMVDPWSDLRIARLVVSIPQHLVQTPSCPKRLTRLALQTMAPPAVVEPLAKVIPVAFFDQHLRHDPNRRLDDLTTDMSSVRAGYAQPQGVREHVAAFRQGRPLDSNFWALVTLELWLRNHW